MQLVADRFLALDDGRRFDLVTGDRVVMRIEGAGDARARARWLVRCDTLQRLQHRLIAPLIDFGLIGIAERFEAWRCGDEACHPRVRVLEPILSEGPHRIRSSNLTSPAVQHRK